MNNYIQITMKDQEVLKAINVYDLQGDILQSKTIKVTQTEITVTVLTANKLKIEYSTLDFINPQKDNCHIAIWQECVTPPYGDMNVKRVAYQLLPRTTPQGDFELVCDHPDVNFYHDNYCIGFCMGDKLTSVCSYATLVGGVMVVNFESSVFVLNASTEQIAVHYSTPINNNPHANRQYVDLYEADADPISRNCLSIRPLMGDYASGQVTLRVKQGTVLQRGKSYKILYDFNTDYSSYGCEHFFKTPE